MTALAKIGGNNPPDPVEVLFEKHGAIIAEAENWLDGAEVQSEEQMAAVDVLITCVKALESDARSEKDSEYRPHKDGCDRVITKWKEPLLEIGRLKSGLLAIVSPFKQRLAAEKEAKRQIAAEEAAEAARIAQTADDMADMKDVSQRRTADQLAAEAMEAERALQAVTKDKVSGLRKTTVPEIVDPKACINWIASNDKPALREFMEIYVARKTREGVRGIAGVQITEQMKAI